MKICFRSLSIFLILIGLLSGCANSAKNINGPTETVIPQNTNSRSDRCILPIATFAYPVNGTPQGPTPGPTLPLSPWQVEVTIPQPFKGDASYGQFSTDIQFIRDIKTYSEIWVIQNWVNSEKNITGHSIYVYRTDNNSWKEVPSYVDQGQAEIFRLYLGNEGNIWAIASTKIGHAFGYYLGLSEAPHTLGVFNESENKFDLLTFPQNLPLGGVSFDGNKFWIFEQDGPIYDVDPVSLKITRYLDPRESDLAKYNENFPQNLIQNDNALAFVSDGSFYFVDGTPRERDLYTKVDTRIYHFIPEKNFLENIENPLQGEPRLLNLFADRDDNLWAADYGWMDKNRNWYQVIRSPVFITNKLEESSLSWDIPHIVLESSNGNLWFESANGMVSLDPQKGEWCWFTTYQSAIVEGSDQNLWMAVEGKLYKNAAGN